MRRGADRGRQQPDGVFAVSADERLKEWLTTRDARQLWHIAWDADLLGPPWTANMLPGDLASATAYINGYLINQQLVIVLTKKDQPPEIFVGWDVSEEALLNADIHLKLTTPFAIAPITRRRLRDGWRALARPLPRTQEEARRYLVEVNDGLAALQSLDDLGEERNQQAQQDEDELLRRRNAVKKQFDL